MQDLGTLGGAGSNAVAINDLGQVTGDADTSAGLQHAFRWTTFGGMRDLGTLGGAGSNAVGSTTRARSPETLTPPPASNTPSGGPRSAACETSARSAGRSAAPLVSTISVR
jgi:probable HAF family extracellular repeat protein